MAETSTTSDTTRQKPTWDETWARIGSEDMLAAKALIELSPSLLREATSWLSYDERPVYASDDWDAEQIGTERGEAQFDCEAWLKSYDEQGRGWSTTEHHLFAIVASMLDPERPIHLRRVLGYMGSWETDVWRILVNWGTGGNNRQYQGRATVVAR